MFIQAALKVVWTRTTLKCPNHQPFYQITPSLEQDSGSSPIRFDSVHHALSFNCLHLSSQGIDSVPAEVLCRYEIADSSLETAGLRAKLNIVGSNHRDSR